jgi:MoxR-like ATPase
MLLRYTGKISAPSPASGKISGEAALREREWVYLPDPGLVQAVNIALLLEQPLLVTGEPGVGKTKLADSVAAELKLGEVLRFDTKSNSTFRDLFYEFDSLRSFRDAQNQVKNKTSLDYISYKALGQAILLANTGAKVEKFVRGFVHPGEPSQSLVLIDEVDKAPRDFPNDILRELLQMWFAVPELEAQFEAPQLRPVVIVTSNSERQLPAAFLRRCVYHHIPFPEAERLKLIVSERLGEDFPANGKLLLQTVDLFYELRSDTLNLHKKPSTAELLGWIVTLQHHFRDPQSSLASGVPFVLNTLGCVVKDSQDMRSATAAAEKWLQQVK